MKIGGVAPCGRDGKKGERAREGGVLGGEVREKARECVKHQLSRQRSKGPTTTKITTSRKDEQIVAWRGRERVSIGSRP